MQHPDHPITFKPAIARYDWDQTYDVLEFVHLPQGFDGLMQQLGIPCFELMAIDRFTPYRYLWAERYSDYVFNFLKQFNFSPHNSILERLLTDESGQAIKDSNNNNITVPPFLFTGDKYSKTAEYKVTLTEGSYEVTGLIYQGWKDGVIGSIPTINQASYRFTLTEPTDIDLNKIINHWCNDELEPVNDNRFCCNSLVVSKFIGSQWQQITVNAPKFLFYSDIADYFSEVSDALLQYFDHVFNNFNSIQGILGSFTYPLQSYLYRIEHTVPYEIKYIALNEYSDLNINIGDELDSEYTTGYSLSLVEQRKFNNINVGFLGQSLLNFPKSSMIDRAYQYSTFPSYFTNLSLLSRANNNKWNTGSLYSDLGNNGIIYNNTYLFLNNLHINFKEKNNINLQLYRTNNLINVVFTRQSDLNILMLISVIFSFPLLINFSLPNYHIPLIPFYCKTVKFNFLQEIVNEKSESGVYYQEYSFSEVQISDSCYNQERELSISGLQLTKSFINSSPNFYGFYPIEKDVLLYLENIIFTENEFVELNSYNAVSDEDYLAYLLTTKAQLEEYMVDSVRIKEIHACLGAKEASYYNDSQGNPKEVVMSIARKLDLLCKWQGINVKLNGEYQRTQSTKYYPPGRTIPPGWYYDRVGINGGYINDTELYQEVTTPLSIDDQRVGMAYPVRSNLGLEADDGLNIVKGGAVCCNNILQYLDTALDDLAKAIDWEEMGTGAITVGDKVFIYEGMLDILQEILFLVSDNNNNTEESKIAIGVTQQVTKEILKAIGLAYGVKTFDYNIDGQGIPDTIEGRPVLKKSVQVPYPGTIYGAPTLVDILLAILANQGVANAGNISLKNEKLQEILRQNQQNTNP